jgi:hypothetical protein
MEAPVTNARRMTMSPLVKRLVAAIMIKKAIDAIRTARQPKRRGVPVVPIAALATAGGAGAYLVKSGRFGPLVDRIKSRRPTGSSTPDTDTTSPLRAPTE